MMKGNKQYIKLISTDTNQQRPDSNNIFLFC